LLSPNARVLYVACGTGDLSIALFENIGARVTGLISAGRCWNARRESNRGSRSSKETLWQLPFDDAVFDAATLLRPAKSLQCRHGLTELRRVLKPNGWTAILEFSRPLVPGFRSLQLCTARACYRDRRLISGSRSAYEYLPDSVSRFPDQENALSHDGCAGFADVELKI